MNTYTALFLAIAIALTTSASILTPALSSAAHRTAPRFLEVVSQPLLPGYLAGLLVVWFLLSFFVAFVQVARDRGKTIEALRGQLAEARNSKIPNIKPRIERVTINGKGVEITGPWIIVTISVANEGYQSEALNWLLTMTIAGQAVPLPVYSFGPHRYVREVSDMVPDGTGGEYSAVYDEDSTIAAVTSDPITMGPRPSGFYLAGLRMEPLPDLAAFETLQISCVDYLDGTATGGLRPGVSPKVGFVSIGDKQVDLVKPYGYSSTPDIRDMGRRFGR